MGPGVTCLAAQVGKACRCHTVHAATGPGGFAVSVNDIFIRYISVNEEQMRYDVFRGKGYDIGSGAVEGACKYGASHPLQDVVGKRLKQSGMIWTRAGSSATLALRICWLNGQWDSFWQQKPLAA